MSAAQTAAGSGGEPLTTRRCAGAQAGTGCGRRPRVIACHVGRDALVAMAALPVAAQAQVVGAYGSLEAGQPAHQAAPVPRTVRTRRPPGAEGLDVAGPAGLEAV